MSALPVEGAALTLTLELLLLPVVMSFLLLPLPLLVLKLSSFSPHFCSRWFHAYPTVVVTTNARSCCCCRLVCCIWGSLSYIVRMLHRAKISGSRAAAERLNGCSLSRLSSSLLPPLLRLLLVARTTLLRLRFPTSTRSGSPNAKTPSAQAKPCARLSSRIQRVGGKSSGKLIAPLWLATARTTTRTSSEDMRWSSPTFACAERRVLIARPSRSDTGAPAHHMNASVELLERCCRSLSIGSKDGR